MNSLPTHQEKILELARGFQVSQCLFTATALGIPDALKNGVKSCAELAEITQTHSDSLYRLLRVLTNLGLVNEIAPQQFEATDLATCLQEDAPNSLKEFILLRAEQDYACWQNLPYSIKTGKSAFEETFGMSRYDYNHQNTEHSERFDRTMSALENRQKQAILSTYDFSAIESLADIGGGQGGLLMAILKQYPKIQAVLFDQTTTIQRAQELLEQEQLDSRCETVAGSFFDALPSGKEVYLLKHVLHNWDNAQAVQILQNCRNAMTVGKKLLIIENVISENSTQRSVLLDLMMLVSFASGKLRTEAAFSQLLQASGFVLKQILATPSDLSIIEAIAV